MWSQVLKYKISISGTPLPSDSSCPSSPQSPSPFNCSGATSIVECAPLKTGPLRGIADYENHQKRDSPQLTGAKDGVSASKEHSIERMAHRVGSCLDGNVQALLINGSTLFIYNG
jgi:hypothetical protein